MESNDQPTATQQSQDKVEFEKIIEVCEMLDIYPHNTSSGDTAPSELLRRLLASPEALEKLGLVKLSCSQKLFSDDYNKTKIELIETKKELEACEKHLSILTNSLHAIPKVEASLKDALQDAEKTNQETAEYSKLIFELLRQEKDVSQDFYNRYNVKDYENKQLNQLVISLRNTVNNLYQALKTQEFFTKLKGIGWYDEMMAIADSQREKDLV